MRVVDKGTRIISDADNPFALLPTWRGKKMIPRNAVMLYAILQIQPASEFLNYFPTVSRPFGRTISIGVPTAASPELD